MMYTLYQVQWYVMVSSLISLAFGLIMGAALFYFTQR